MHPTLLHTVSRSHQSEVRGPPSSGRLPVVLVGASHWAGGPQSPAARRSGKDAPLLICSICQGAHRSPLPNIYDEAAREILSLGMHLGFCSGKQVGFASQKLLWSQFIFFPRSLLLCIKQKGHWHSVSSFVQNGLPAYFSQLSLLSSISEIWVLQNSVHH